MNEKQSYNDSRFEEDPKAIVVGRKKLTTEEEASQKQFDQDMEKLLAEGKIEFLESEK
ncbi:hypothetical protein [Eubacterium barkeri]|uniref:Uncharacterized protein n=1 Tax=Eubacterium barkeri TaxID=1528 RepID=A0A1H3HCX7_EUBBA|nr:hypothetical protein [Eubacterium barkeri]SDY13433.1 hypothetical protein SAMN04488579_11751 [Eubacterium barkeri]